MFFELADDDPVIANPEEAEALRLQIEKVTMPKQSDRGTLSLWRPRQRQVQGSIVKSLNLSHE